MRRTLLSLLLVLLLCPPSYGQQMLQGIVGGQTSVVCDTATHYIGVNGTGTDDNSFGSSTQYCNRFMSTCPSAGKVSTGYFYCRSNHSSYGSVCIYSDLGTAGTPDVADLKLSCISSLNDAGPGWVSGAMDTLVTIQPNTYYWVCIHADSASWYGRSQNGSTRYTAVAGSPPANLTGFSSSGATEASAYISIGPQ